MSRRGYSGLTGEASRQIAIRRRVQKFFPKVKEVHDAEDALELTVLPKDISHSKSREHDACAIARACKRAMHLTGALIARSRAYLIKGNVATRYVLSQSAIRELVAFDRGGKFTPGTYDLLMVPETDRLTSPPRGAGKQKRKNPKRIHARHAIPNIRASFSTEKE